MQNDQINLIRQQLEGMNEEQNKKIEEIKGFYEQNIKISINQSIKEIEENWSQRCKHLKQVSD